MWDPPRPGLEPVSPALAGRFSTTAPPGKPCTTSWLLSLLCVLDRRHSEGASFRLAYRTACSGEFYGMREMELVKTGLGVKSRAFCLTWSLKYLKSYMLFPEKIRKQINVQIKINWILPHEDKPVFILLHVCLDFYLCMSILYLYIVYYSPFLMNIMYITL